MSLPSGVPAHEDPNICVANLGYDGGGPCIALSRSIDWSETRCRRPCQKSALFIERYTLRCLTQNETPFLHRLLMATLLHVAVHHLVAVHHHHHHHHHHHLMVHQALPMVASPSANVAPPRPLQSETVNRVLDTITIATQDDSSNAS